MYNDEGAWLTLTTAVGGPQQIIPKRHFPPSEKIVAGKKVRNLWDNT